MKTILSHLWLISSEIRNFLYNKNILKSKSFPEKFLIGIGNLEISGTGKTTLTIELAKYFEAKNYKVGIFTSNYKGQAKKGIFYEPNSNLNDESNLILSQTNAVLGVKEIPQNAEIILIDDSFQKRYLKKDFEICLVANLNEEKCFPLGKLREQKKNISRANEVIFTKEAFFETPNESIKLDFSQGFVVGFQEKYLPQNLISISATGNFEWFKKCLELNSIKTKKDFNFRDHSNFKKEEIKKILFNFPDHFILTTEKDFPKFLNLGFTEDKVLIFKTKINLEEIQPILEKLELLLGRESFNKKQRVENEV